MSNFSITAKTLDAAITAADERIAETNAADYAGIPYTSYVIFAVEGLYGTSYEVSFTAEYSVVAGANFYAQAA